MAGFGDYKVAAATRDVIERIAEGVVNRLRPDLKIGSVYSATPDGTAEIQFPGHSAEELMQVRFSPDKMPWSTTMVPGMTGVPDIVRVAGKPGAYFIDSFVAGYPKPRLGTRIRVGYSSSASSLAFPQNVETLRRVVTFPYLKGATYHAYAMAHPRVDIAGGFSGAHLKWATTDTGITGTAIADDIVDHRAANRTATLPCAGDFTPTGLNTNDLLSVKLTLLTSSGAGTDEAVSWGPMWLACDLIVP